MKKTYINPTIEVVKLNIAQNLLIGSAVSFDDLGGGEVTLDPSIELNPGSLDDEVLSPDFDIVDYDKF